MKQPIRFVDLIERYAEQKATVQKGITAQLRNFIIKVRDFVKRH